MSRTPVGESPSADASPVNPPGRGGAALVAGALAAAAIAGLFAQQLVAFPRLKLAAVEAAGAATPRAILAAAKADPAALALLGAPFLALGILIAWPAPRRAFFGGLARAAAAPRPAFLLLMLLAAVAGRFHLDPGIPHQFDAKGHLMEAAVAARAFADGEAPLYSFEHYLGMPSNRFRGPLLYVLAAGVGLVLGSVAAGLKAVLFAAHLGAAAAAWRLARKLGAPPAGALFAGLALSLTFVHTHEVVLNGRLPVALLYVFFPLLLAEVHGLATAPRLRHAVAGGAWAGLLVLTHPGLAPAAVAAAGLFGIGVFATAPGRLAILKRALPLCLVAALAGAALAAGLVYGAAAEQSGAHLATMYDGSFVSFTGGFDPEPWRRLLRWNFLPTEESVAYAGASIVALFLAFVARRPRVALPLLLAAAFLGWLLGGGYLQVRAVHFLTVVLACGAGLFAATLSPRWVAIAFALLVVDLGPTTFQSPFRPDLKGDQAYVRELAGARPGRRALRIGLRDGRAATSEWATNYGAPLPVLSGPFREACPTVYPAILDALAAVNADLAAGPALAPETLRALRLLGIGLVPVEDGRGPVAPEIEGLPPLPGAPPVLAGPGTLVPWLVDDERLAALRSAESLAGATTVLAAEPLAAPAVAEAWIRPREAGARFTTAAAGTVLVALSPWPGVEFRLDGEAVQPEELPVGVAALPVAAGEHELTVRYAPPPRLAAAWIVSLAAAVLLALLSLLSLFLRHRPTSR